MLEKKDEQTQSLTEEATTNPSVVDKDSKGAVEEVENSVAESAEKKEEQHQIPMLDYDTMELEALTEELKKLLKDHPIQQIRQHVDAIKHAFSTKFKALLSEKKEAFLSEGGNAIDFQFSSPIKSVYNQLLADYKNKRNAYYKDLEEQLQKNLEKRNAIIEALKDVIEKADPSTMYNEYKALNDQWKLIGPVPRNRYNDTWKTYHHHVERFYDLLHLNKDFKELEFKHNLEEKLKLITRAEALAEREDVNKAFIELQELHRLWKEEIGPVDKEHREDVWTRFSNATKKLHDRRHEYFKELRAKQQQMIEAKLQVVAEIDAYDTSNNTTHKDWQNSIKDIEALRQKYFEIGKLPYNKSEAVWQEFKKATKKFNTAKNTFYKEEKRVQGENLKKKMALVELAESLKDSEDWDETTNTLKRIQADWKKIGHVPRKYSDDIWKRFKGACNHYFDRLHDRDNGLNKEQQQIVEAKKEYLEELKSGEALSLEQAKQAIEKWEELGVLPRNARYLDDKFSKAIGKKVEGENVGKDDIEMLKFKGVIDTYVAQQDFRKLDSEQLFIRRKIDDTVRDMQQLENNLSFISNATEDNPLVKNVRKGIQTYKEELDVWQAKLDYLKKIGYND